LSINQDKFARSWRNCEIKENTDEVAGGVNLPMGAVSIPIHGEAVRGLVPLQVE
jgi:hypothetical protein